MKKKILLVDDDKVITDMYSAKFEESGWETKVAGSVAQAIKVLKSEYVPDLILLDIIMPGENGIEFLKRLRRDQRLDKTKIVLLSNLDYQDEAGRGISSLISGYYLKAQITPSELSKKINELL